MRLPPGGNAGSARDEADAQQRLVGRRTLEVKAVVAQQVAMVGRIDDDGVVAHAQPVEFDEDTADGMVDQRDHAVIVRRHLAQLRLRLVRHARELGAEIPETRVGERRFALQRGAVPPGAAVEVLPALDRQLHLVRMVQQAPRLRAVEGMVRVRERDPGATGRARLPVLQPLDRAVRAPRAAMHRGRHAGTPGLRRARARLRLGRPEVEYVRIAGLLERPALEMLPVRRRERFPAVVEPVPEHHQLDMAEAHIGPEPGRVETGRAVAAFRRAGRREGAAGREMRLADEGRVVALRVERRCEAAFARLRAQVDAVVRHAVGQRQEAGQHGGPRGLAHKVRRDAGVEMRPLRRQPVEMRGLHAPAGEAVAVGALLVGGDEEDVRPVGHGASPRGVKGVSRMLRRFPWRRRARASAGAARECRNARRRTA